MNKIQLLDELKSYSFPELIIKAFEKVKRENFVPENLREFAYLNQPLPTAKGSTISQPYTIAFMLNLLELERLTDKKLITYINSKQESSSKQERSINQTLSKISKSQKFDIANKIKILEIGSGSGYVLTLINEILKSLKIKKIRDYELYGIEIIYELVKKSKAILKNEKKIKIIKSDGSKGLKEKAPFDRILASAAFSKIPEHLFSQLKVNGILVTPVNNSIFQFKKKKNKIEKKEFPGFVFVPVLEGNI